MAALRDHYLGWLTSKDDLLYDEDELQNLTRDEVAEELLKLADDKWKAKEEKYGEPLMRELERAVLLRNVDTKWMDHIDAMDELKKGIYLRGYAQRDPVVEYRLEGFDMFDEMIAAIREDTTKMLMSIELKRTDEAPERKQVAKPTSTSGGSDGTLKKQPKKADKKPGPNDPCPCGSGKKYKNCHGKDAN